MAKVEKGSFKRQNGMGGNAFNKRKCLKPLVCTSYAIGQMNNTNNNTLRQCLPSKLITLGQRKSVDANPTFN
jgi:hypothetical protein